MGMKQKLSSICIEEFSLESTHSEDSTNNIFQFCYSTQVTILFSKITFENTFSIILVSALLIHNIFVTSILELVKVR